LQEQLLKAKVVFVNLQNQQKKTDVDLEILQRLLLNSFSVIYNRRRVLLNLKVVSDDRRNEQNDFKVLIYARR